MGEAWDGQIDELRIYNRSLSQREIMNDMQGGLIRKGLYRSASAGGSYSNVVYGGVARSCKELQTWGINSSGYYWLDFPNDGQGPVYTACDMTNNGGGWTLVWHGLPTQARYLATDGQMTNLANNITFNEMMAEGVNLNFRVTDTVGQTAKLGKTIPEYFSEVGLMPDSPPYSVHFHNAATSVQDVLLTNNYFLFGYGNSWRVFYTCINVNAGGDFMYLGGYSPTCTPRATFKPEELGCTSSGNYCYGSLANTPVDSGLGLSLRQYQETKLWVRESTAYDSSAAPNYTDTAATDTAAPATPAAPAATALSTTSINVSWPSVSDNGNTYYYYVNAYDSSGDYATLYDQPVPVSGYWSSTYPWSGYIPVDSSKPLYVEVTASMDGTSDSGGSGIIGGYIQQFYDTAGNHGGYNATEHWTEWCSPGFATTDAGQGYVTRTKIFIPNYAYGGGTGIMPSTKYIKWGSFIYQVAGTPKISSVRIYQVKDLTVTSGTGSYYVAGSGGTGANAWYTGTNATITGLSPNTQYCFNVTARDNVLNVGAVSATVCNYTMPGLPSGLTVAPMQNQPLDSRYGMMNISWSANGNPGGTSYQVLDVGASQIIYSGTATSYQHGVLPDNTQYCYQVRSVNAGGVPSAYTSSVCAITLDRTEPVMPNIYPSLGSAAHPGKSCKRILGMNRSSASGTYWLDPDGAGGRAPFQAYCDMVSNGGGWTLLALEMSYVANFDLWATYGDIYVNGANTNNILTAGAGSNYFYALPFANSSLLNFSEVWAGKLNTANLSDKSAGAQVRFTLPSGQTFPPNARISATNTAGNGWCAAWWYSGAASQQFETWFNEASGCGSYGGQSGYVPRRLYNASGQIAWNSNGDTGTGTNNNFGYFFARESDDNGISLDFAENDSGLTLYMPFEDGSGNYTYDWSQSRNNATLVNGSAWTTSGKYGSALTFNGGTSQALLSSWITPGNGPWTISAWVKTTGANGGVLTHSGSGPVTSGMAVYGGVIYFTNYNGTWQTHSGTTVVNDGNWHYLTWDNVGTNTMQMYVDGLPDGGTFNSYTTNGGPLNTMGYGWWWGMMNGQIDDLRVYSRSLSQREIINDMQSGTIYKTIARANSTSGNFTPVNGTFVDFSSGNDNGWTHNGGAWTVTGGEYISPTGDESVSVTGDPAWTDYVTEVDFKIVSGTHASLIFRSPSISQFYQYEIYGTGQSLNGGNINLYKYNSGYNFLAVANTPTLSYGTWYQAKAMVKGSNMQLYLNDVLVLNYTDASSPYLAGKAGVGTHYAENHFKNFKVTPLLSTPFVNDTAARDIAGPPQPSAPNVTGLTSSTLNITWQEVNDTGTNYYYTQGALDANGNYASNVPNQGFEQGATGWGAGQYAILDTSIAHNGNASFKTLPGVGESQGGNFPVLPGRTYRATIWVKTTSSNEPTSYHFAMINSTTGYIGEYPSPAFGDAREWKEISVTMTTPSNCDSMYFHLKNDGSGTIWYDDIRVEELRNFNITTGTKDYYITGTGANAYFSGTSTVLSGLSPNTYYCYNITPRDFANNLGTASLQGCGWTVPAAPIVNSTTNTIGVCSNNSNVSFTATGSADHYHYVWNTTATAPVLNTDTWWSGALTYVTATLSSNWYMHVVSHNIANVSSPINDSGPYPIDITAPGTPSPSATPANWTTLGYCAISYAAVADAGCGNSTISYEYMVDSGNWTSVGTQVSFNTVALTGGSHIISVRAYDAAGNRGAAGTTICNTNTPPTLASAYIGVEEGNATYADGLVGYWKLDESNGTFTAEDSSGSGNAGTYYNITTQCEPDLQPMLSNGGMDAASSGLATYWSVAKTAPGTYVTSDAEPANTMGGARTQKIVATDVGHARYTQSLSNLQNNTMYRVTMAYKATGSGTMTMYGNYDAANGGPQGSLFSSYLTLDNAWHTFDYTFVTGGNLAGTGYIDAPRIDSLTGVATIYVDNVTITRICPQGRIGKAQRFDGVSGNVGLGGFTNFSANNFTMSAWVKPAGSGYRAIASKGDAGVGVSKGWRVRLEDSGRILFTVTGDTEVASSPTQALSSGEWYFISVTKDADMKTYLNGALVQTDTAPTGSIDTAVSAYIGKQGAWYWNGMIDDVRIYNRSLSSTEVLEIYNQTAYTSNDIVCAPNGTADVDAGPVSYIYNWYVNSTPLAVLNMPFDTNVTSTAAGAVKDYSGASHPGTLSSSPPAWTTSGMVGGAYRFDSSGNNNIAATVPSVLSNAGYSFSIDAWVNPGTNAQTSSEHIVVGKLGWHGGMLATGSSGSTILFRFQYMNATGGWFGADSSWVPINTWHHVAVTYNADNRQMKMFVDGVEGSSSTFVGTPTSYSDTLYIGGYASSGTQYGFNGTIDQVGVYPRALSADEIRAHYQLRYWQVKDAETTKGENWTCEVTVSDGKHDSTTLNTSTVYIRNTKPNICAAYISNTTAKLDSPTAYPTQDLMAWYSCNKDADIGRIKLLSIYPGGASCGQTGACYLQSVVNNDGMGLFDVTCISATDFNTGAYDPNKFDVVATDAADCWQCALNASMKQAIRDYVANGGGFLATHDTLCCGCGYSGSPALTGIVDLFGVACGGGDYSTSNAYQSKTGEITQYPHVLPSNFTTLSLHTECGGQSITSAKRWYEQASPADDAGDDVYLLSTRYGAGRTAKISWGHTATTPTAGSGESKAIINALYSVARKRITPTYSWNKDGAPYAVLSMPFDTNVTSTASGAVKDYSGYSNNGTLSSPAPVWTAAGMVGGAYNFSGSNIIDAGSAMAGTWPALTIEAWVNPSSYGSWRAIVQTGPASDHAFYLQGAAPHFYPSCNGNTSVALNTWSHVAAVINGSDIVQYYVNGVAAGGCAASGLRYVEYLHVSGQSTGDGENFQGLLDQVMVYNRSLTAEEIKAHFNLQYDKIITNELDTGQQWNATITPSDSQEDGTARRSRNITITGQPGYNDCGVLDIPNYVYVQRRNVASFGTCYIVTAPNVTLDCQGRTITGSNQTNSYGLYTNQYNTTVKNCVITNYHYPLYYSSATYGAMLNDTLDTTHASGSGFFLETAHYNNITSVRANATPGSWGGAAMRISGSNYNTITTSNATTFGPSTPAIWLQGDSYNNILSYVRANASVATSDGLGLLAQNAYNGEIRNSTIAGSRGIVIASASTGNRILDSTGIGAGSYGIGFEQASNYNSVINSNGTSASWVGIRADGSSYNNITNSRGTSTSYRGVQLYSGANYNRLTGVTATALGGEVGLDVLSSNNNIIDSSDGISNGWLGIALSYSNGNTVNNSRGTSSGGAGIQLYTADNNSLSNTNGTISGASGFGIYLTTGSDYNSLDRVAGITNSTVWNHAGIFVEISTYNNITNSAGRAQVSGAQARGIELYNGANYNKVQNSVAYSQSDISLLVYASSTNNNIINNTASSPNHGLMAYASANSNLFANNTATNDGIPLYIYSSTLNTFIGNNATSTSSYGAYVVTGTSNRFANNTITSQTVDAVYMLAQSNGNNVTGSTLSAPSGIGVLILNSTGNEISTSAITAGSYGIYFDPLSNSSKALGNTIASTGHGVYAELCSGGAISQNTIVTSGASHGIYVLGGTGYTMSSNNVTVGAGRGIFLSYSTFTAGNNVLTDNYATSGGAGTGISIENTGTNTFTNNRGTSATGYGIYLAGSTANSFLSDTGDSGSDAGIYLVNSPSNNFTNVTGVTSTGKAMYLRLDSDSNTIANAGLTATTTGTALLVEGSAHTNITGTNATARDGNAILLSTAATGSHIEGANAVSVAGNGISIANGATGTSIVNSTATSETASGISIAAQYTNVTGTTAFASSGAASSSCGIKIDGTNNVRVTASAFYAAAGTAVCVESGSNNNYVYDNTLTSSSGTSDLLHVTAGAYSNTFYWNIFGNTGGKYAIDEGSGNIYNVSMSGQGEGNSWYNLAVTGEVDICGSRHTVHPGWPYYIGGSSNAEPSQYPYNPQNSKTRVSGAVVDYAPMTTQRCAPPPPQPPQNYTEAITCETKACNIDSDCMSGQAPYCDAGCNQLTHTCYPCVACDNAYCLPQGSVCGNARVLAGCGEAACNAGVCTSSGGICPGTPLLSCCPSTYCSSGRCVPKLAAGQQCINSSQCAPTAPYCAGPTGSKVCATCIPINSETSCTSSNDCCPYAGNSSGVCNLAPGTANYGVCITCLPEGGRSCASTSDCCGGLTCKTGTCAVNNPPAAPATPVLALSTVNATEAVSCVQNCPASNLPTDPDRDTPVKIQYKWQVGITNATSFWHQSTTFNCELLSSGCQGLPVKLMARACDQYGACSAAVTSAPITLTTNNQISCQTSACDLLNRCCVGRVCKYSQPGASSGACCIADPTLTCTTDSQCCSGRCRTNDQGAKVCVGALVCGQICTTSSDCPSGCSFCAQGTCRACIPVNSAAQCTDNSQCCPLPGRSAGICDIDTASNSYGTCVAGLADGLLCTANSDCLSNRCQQIGTTNLKVCAPAVLACSYKGGACIGDAGCCSGFCDRLNTAGPVAIASYGSNNTLVLDYGQCTDKFAPFTKCDTYANAAHFCADGYPCTEYAGTGVHYCTGGAGTQFNGWVKVNGVNFDRSGSPVHTGSSSAAVYGMATSYAYNSALMNALEGQRKYMLGFWAYITTPGTLARYAVFDSVNNAYLTNSGIWAHAIGPLVPDGGIIEPTSAQTGTWKQVVKVFKTLPNAKLQLRFYPISQDTTYYIDDVEVTQANDFAMLAWLRADAAQPGGTVISQVSNLGSGARQGINWSITSGNLLYLNMYSASTQLPAGPTTLSPSVFIGDGKWHQVALTVDRMGNYSVYLDGKPVQSAAFTLGALNSSNALYIGGSGTGSGFSGELGEVRFYKRSLKPADIADHYAGWFQQVCSISLAVKYTTPAAQNLSVAYNADLRIRKLLPETILAMPFDVNASSDAQGMITDYSRFLGHGTKTGAAWTPAGKIGGAYIFNVGRDTDRILLPSPLISGTGDFTLSAWIYPTNTAPANFIMGNYGVGNSGGVEYYVYNGKLGMYISGYLASATTVPANAWTHVVATRTNGMGRLYINGVLDQSGALPAAITANRNFAIGNGPDYSTEKFVGKIDEVRVLSRALTAAEVAALYTDNGLVSSSALPVSQK